MDIKWASYEKMIEEARKEGFEITQKGFDDVTVIWSGETLSLTTLNELEKFLIGFTMGGEHVAKQVIASRE